ncbi:MAG TPA: hypothetical protein VF754_02675 [Pyrinomonadaceae bacterium]
MSSEQEQIRALAERIARRLATRDERGDAQARTGTEAGHEDLSALRAGLSEIQRRLAHIESHIRHDETCDDLQAARAPHEQPPQHAARPSVPTGVREDAEPRAHASHARWLSGTYMPATEHPSTERFGINEAVSEIVDYFEREKTCSMEPGNKPCDHCAMCSSRGF